MSNHELCLIYTEPTQEEALEWASVHVGEAISGFCCRYPGRYWEAAEMMRKVLRMNSEDEQGNV